MAVIDEVRALILELRLEGMSQADVGKAFGRSQGWVSQVLDGTIHEVKAETIATVDRRLPGRLRRSAPEHEPLVPRVVDEFIAAHPRAKPYAQRLRAIDWLSIARAGGFEITPGFVHNAWSEMTSQTDLGPDLAKKPGPTKATLGAARKR